MPAPGSPPISTAEPITMPPPKTRSSSASPLLIRGSSAISISDSGLLLTMLPAKPDDLDLRDAAAEDKRTSDKVFQALHAEHCPCHLL